MAEADRVRLHITPFSETLLDRYIPASLQPRASNISFHTIETFPERAFGYVELPAMEAEKLKKKFNGTTLKGSKVKIEKAKPEKKRKIDDALEEVDQDEADRKARKKAKKEKRKREEGVIEGYELPEGRHVKRGWADGVKAKKQKKEGDKDSTEGKKLRFKTVMPPNKTVDEKNPKKSKTKEKKEKSESKRKAGKETVVREGAKTTKLGAISAKGYKKPAAYEEGIGWVDENGDVVEAEPPAKKRKRNKKIQEVLEPVPESATAEDHETNYNVERGANEDSESESESEVEEPPAVRAKTAPKRTKKAPAEDDQSSASSISHSEASTSDRELEDDENEDDRVDRQLNEAKTNTATNTSVEREMQNSIPVDSAMPSAEALAFAKSFKRVTTPQPTAPRPNKPSPIDTSFSFFSGDAQDEDEIVAENSVPQTPRTKEDLESRSTRSAAPTPDTAAIGKVFDFSLVTENDSDEDMNDVDHDVTLDAIAENEKAEGKKEESEFRKWFYENRGDLNRGWKKRRREEKKILRQRENRRLNRRIA